jgi:hypothetical protein
MVDGLSLVITKDIDFLFYKGCAYGKQHCQSFPTNIVCKKVYILSELIHANLCGPMNVAYIGNTLYFVLFKDNYTGYLKHLSVYAHTNAMQHLKFYNYTS